MSFELRVLGVRELARTSDEVPIGVVAQHEADSVLRPTVEMRRHRKIRVTAQQDVVEAASTTKFDGSVEYFWRAVVRRPVAASIHHEERLSCVRERDEQGVVSPNSVVRDVHAFLTFAGRRHE